MTREELGSLARQWISLWSVPVDWRLYDRLHAEEFEDCSSAGRGTGKADFRSGSEALVVAFPDLKTQVDDLVIDEEALRIAVRWTAIGTHKGLFLGQEPSNRRMPMTGIEIIEVRDGCIVRRWGEWDVAASLAQA